MFQSVDAGAKPRVTQAYVEVTYRTVTSSTVYAGGVYEKKSDGSATKYYAAGGAKVVRQVPPGAGAGTLSWLLADHLGTAVGALDGAGALVATQRYWPYGAVRSGGVTQTDKLYTGQQMEPVDAALGLYNYKARFYSTTLGRFVSADPVTNSGMNRYAFVRNRPTVLIDPTGLTANIACGTGNRCSGGDVGLLRNAIITDWLHDTRYPGADLAFLNWMFDKWLIPALQHGFSVHQTVDVFGLAFLDTGGSADAGKDGAFGWGDVDRFLAHNAEFGPGGATLWIGYSMGGGTVLSALSRAYNRGGPLPLGALLLEPAVRRYDGNLAKGLSNYTRVITVRDPDFTVIPLVHKPVAGVHNVIEDSCSGDDHCPHEGSQSLLVNLAYIPPGSLYDAEVEAALGANGLDFEIPSSGGCSWYELCNIGLPPLRPIWP